jgi:hypothetical protein
MSTSALNNGALALQSLTVNSVAITPPIGGTGATTFVVYPRTVYATARTISNTIGTSFIAGNLYQYVWNVINPANALWSADAYLTTTISAPNAGGQPIAGAYISSTDWSAESGLRRTYTISFVATVSSSVYTVDTVISGSSITIALASSLIKINGT